MSSPSERRDSDRRGFLRKIVSLAASAGVVGLLLDRLSDKSIPQPVQATGGASGTALIIDASGPGDQSNTGTSTTQLNSSGTPTLIATNTGGGAALEGSCTAGTGVLGTTTIGTGVQGTASAATGVAVGGFAGDPGAIPIVAQGSSSQTANLQEWRGSSGILSSVDKNGNFGIGTGAPQYLLHLVGEAYQLYVKAAPGESSYIITDTTSPNMQCSFNFFDEGVGKWQFGKQTDNTFFMYDGVNGREFFFVDHNRKAIGIDPTALPYKVGVGTGNPAFTLDVAGQVHATAFLTSSDMRFKADIEPIDNALDKIMRLNGVYFKWNHLHRDVLKRSSTKAKQVGLIAQEVKEVIPEIVSEWKDKGADDYLAVDYSRLVAVLVEAVKEQQKKVEALQEQLGALQQTIERFEAS
jgi:hypothetical protein